MTTGAAAELAVIEGFYGAPWSHEARRRMVGFAASVGVGTFIWAPKNDPAHRDAWEERPTLRHVAATAELAAEAASVGVRWVYGISPVLQRGRTSRDASSISARLAPIQAAGVGGFLLAFDDTWPTFVPRFATRALGRAHGEVARAVADDLSARDPACEVLVVPAVYSGRAAELPSGGLAYLTGLAERLGGLRVAWTGPRIFSPWISGADVASLEAATGLRLWIWTNGIANDWLPLVSGSPFGLRYMERLSGGPLGNLAADLVQPGRLIALNGAREADLTLPHVASLAGWAKDPFRFDGDVALRAGLARAFGEGAAPSLAVLFDACSRHALAAPARLDLRRLDAAVSSFVARIGDRQLDAGAAERVRAELAVLAALPDALAASLDDHVLRMEVFGAARKLSVLARAGMAAVDVLADASDRSVKRGRIATIAALLREAASIRWDVGEAPIRRLVSLARRA